METDSMVAGPELDATIEEEVMQGRGGFRCPRCNGRKFGSHESLAGVFVRSCHYPTCHWTGLPKESADHYSADMTAAMKVLDRFDFACLTDQGADRNCPGHLRWYCSLHPRGEGQTNADPQYSASAPTAPLAICLAALAAVANSRKTASQPTAP